MENRLQSNCESTNNSLLTLNSVFLEYLMKIELDFDVWQALQAARKSEADSTSAVIRRAMNLPEPQKQRRPWITKDGTFHDGTPFKAEYKGGEYYSKVVDGALVFEGERFKSPSAAARKITGGAVNGRVFWKFKIKGDDPETWIPMKEAQNHQT